MKQKYDVIATGWRQPGSTFKIFTYGGLVERLPDEVLAAKPPPETVEEIAAEVLRRCTVLDAPFSVSLGRGRGIKKIENFHSRSEPEYRGDINLPNRLRRVPQHGRDARRSARRDQERDRSHVSLGYAQGREAHPSAIPHNRNWRVRGQSAIDGVGSRFRERWISSDASIRKRCLPRWKVASLQG